MKKTKFWGLMLFAMVMASACTNVNDPEPDPSSSLPFSETFETGLGKFTTQSVSGDQVWAFDSHKYALMSGYVATVNNANEDWLISPEIDLSNITTAKLTFDHALRYFADPKNEATVWVSSNYVDGLPATATWTQLTSKVFSNFADWTLASSGEISLTAFAGKKVKVAFKYVSTATKAGTWELKNFLVQEGEATVIPGDLVSGNGTEATPYNVAGGIANQGEYKWVKGYIVGYATAGATATVYTFTTDTCSQATNILIAGSKTETDPTKCLAVQLLAGPVRTGLNLKDVKANLSKEVTLYGSLVAYFGKPGLKDVTYYELEGGTKGGTKPTDTSNAIFTETFAASIGAFTNNNVVGAQVWSWVTGYGAVMSGFANSISNQNEDWLISPTINLTGKTSAILTFDHTVNKGVVANMQANHTLWLSDDNGVTWAQMVITTYPAGNNWTFVSSGEIVIPAKYLGKSTFKFAFKYLCSTTESASWEIKNVVLK